MKEYSEATRTVRSELRLQSFLPYILSKLADTISVELSGTAAGVRHDARSVPGGHALLRNPVRFLRLAPGKRLAGPRLRGVTRAIDELTKRQQV